MPQIRIFLSPDEPISHELSEDRATVGRLPDNTLQIEDGSVSSHHAELVAEAGEYKLVDLGSTNGTFVNGVQVTEQLLKSGDHVRFGQIEAIYGEEVAASEGSAQPLPSSERIAASIGGSASGRPASFISASPFPKPKEKTDALSIAAVALGVIGALGFVAAVVSALTLQAPA